MKIRSLSILGTALLALGPVAVMRPAMAQTVKVDGSSTVFPITEAVAEEYQITKRGKVHVTVGIAGTGGGFKKFCRGETDISDASRPILAAEMQVCAAAGIKYLELPIAYDALTVVVNPKASWVDQITIAELHKIWDVSSQSKVTTWKQVNPKWPATQLKLYGPGADSGTFDYFTEAVNGKAKVSRGDYTASEDDNTLVQGVEADAGALGYFGYAYYAPNATRMKALKIVNSKGIAVGPSAAGVLDGSYEPMSRPLFIYVNAASLQKPEVREFVEFYLKRGAEFVSEVKYVPLAEAAYEHAQANLKAGKLGTVFGGTPRVGLRVEELLKMEAKL